MGSVTFSGITQGYLFLGGVAGYLWSSSSYTIYVKNCVIYNDVKNTGNSRGSYIGGFVGEISEGSYKYTNNCANYGSFENMASVLLDSSLFTFIENYVSGRSPY